jgi:hypothetical protein
MMFRLSTLLLICALLAPMPRAMAAIQDVFEVERSQCYAYLAELETRLKGDGATLTPEKMAILAAEQAKVREWLIAERARHSQFLDALNLRGKNIKNLEGLRELAKEMVDTVDAFKFPKSTKFSFEALKRYADDRYKLEKWLETQLTYLASLEKTHPGIGKSSADANDPPQIKQILNQYEDTIAAEYKASLEELQNSHSMEKWQKKIENHIASWEHLNEVRNRLLEEHETLKAKAHLTPAFAENLTQENSRLIEKAAIEYFHIKNDPDQAVRRTQLERQIQEKWREILLAHDGDWAARVESESKEIQRLQQSEKKCGKALKLSTLGSWGGGLTFVSGLVTHAGSPAFSNQLAATGFVALAVSLAAVVVSAEKKDAVVARISNREDHIKNQKKLFPTQEKLREKVTSDLGVPENSCLTGAYHALLHITPAILAGFGEAETLAATEKEGASSPRIRVGHGNEPPNPLDYIQDDAVREATVHRLAELEAAEELEQLLHRGGCKIK